MERANIAPDFVEDALHALRARGLPTAPFLQHAGLPPVLDGPVTNQQYGRLWLKIAEETGDEVFGLGLRPMRPGAFRLMCHAALHAGKLERALGRMLDFLNLVIDEPVADLRIADGMAIITLREDRPPRPAFAYRAYWLIVMGVACWLIGRRIPLRQLEFTCAEPQGRVDYRQFFGAPVLFDQAQTTLSFASSYLSLPIVRSETALRGFLREAPANLLVRYRHDDDISARVRAQLTAMEPIDWPVFDALARIMDLSEATLRRRLRADGQSYGAIKDELRAVLAQRLLRSPQTVAEVATALGYSEPSAFHRAFVKWTGQSPGEFRRLSALKSG